MQRLTAILLLVLFLFNLAGYRILFGFLKQQSDTTFAQVLEKEEYDARDLITIKVDLNIPYVSEQSTFERVTGEIEVRGNVYKFVKRRVVGGQLVLLCIPDVVKTTLQKAEHQFADFGSDGSTTNRNSTNAKNFLLKLMLADFDKEHNLCLSSHSSIHPLDKITSNKRIPKCPVLSSVKQPPDISIC